MRQSPSNRDATWAIHLEETHGRTADRRRPLDNSCNQTKVNIPPLLSRTEEANDDGLRLRVDGGKIRSLVAIAMPTRECQVLGFVSTAVLPGNEMLDVKAEERICFLGNATVLAAVTGAIADEPASHLISHARPGLERTSRARACMIATTS